MCGIAGILSSSRSPNGDAAAAVARMTRRLQSRGPDAEGIWQGGNVVLGHRRLTILDLDQRSNQPMSSSDGRYMMVYNGEIYNFRELRNELEADGASFRTTSDTEVLLALFDREGERMLPRLRGMFAFAIWDTQTRQLFLARDAYGIKPLYYAITGAGVLFASQVKALLASAIVPVEPEPAGSAGFYLWGSVPEPWTLYRDVFSLPAGHWVRIAPDHRPAPVCWHDIRTHWQTPNAELSAEPLQPAVRDAVERSVRAHLVADVPVSVFLSGGIDSAAVAAITRELGADLEGITVGFEEFAGRPEDETATARAIADHYQLRHHVRTVTRAEFEEDLPHILDAMDQPSIDGVNTWFASKAAAERGYKVVLSGIGGDELFCGYPSFQRIPQAAAVGRLMGALPGVPSLLQPAFTALARQRNAPKLAGLPEFGRSIEGLYFLQRALFLPQELPGLMSDEAAQHGLARLGGVSPMLNGMMPPDGVSAVGVLESTLYLRNQLLRDSDWASMAHSVELRTPLVDATLLQTLAPHVPQLAGGIGKRMLARSPRRALPETIINRRKTGFGVPMAKWLDLTPAANGTTAPWARRWATRVLEYHLQPA